MKAGDMNLVVGGFSIGLAVDMNERGHYGYAAIVGAVAIFQFAIAWFLRKKYESE